MKTGGIQYEFEFDQDQPEKLMLAPKPPDIEIRRGNEFYGHAACVKEYAQLPPTYPLRANIEHGLIFNGAPVPHIKIDEVETLLAPSRNRAKILREGGPKPVIPVGFGFLYAKALLEGRGLKPWDESRRAGTLAFPFKSTPKSVLSFDHREYARRLRELPERFQPVVVCLYFLEYLDGVHRAYEEEGIPVVTAGRLHDPNFLFRLYDLCRQFRYSVSNHIGSNLFAAVESGCRYFYVDGPRLERRMKAPEHEDSNVRKGPVFEATYAESRRLFGEPVETTTPEQRKFVTAYIGSDCMRSPRKLRSILLNAHRRQEGRAWWYPGSRLLAPPDASDYRFEEFAPGDGWYRIGESNGQRSRWMGYTTEAWLELSWRHGGQASPARLTCEIAVTASAEILEKLEISVNGKFLSPLRRNLERNGHEIEADVPADVLLAGPEPGRVRIGFRVPEVIPHCDAFPPSPLTRTLGVAVSRVSLRPAQGTGE